VAVVLVVFSLPRLPAGIREYANSPLHPERHPLALNERYRLTLNRAYEQGLPIVAVSGGGGQNAMETCLAYYIDRSHYVDGRPPGIDHIERGASQYLVLRRTGTEDASGRMLAVVRSPFRMAPIGESELPNLSDSSFNGDSRSPRNDDE
jgi:hypothetical protein